MNSLLNKEVEATSSVAVLKSSGAKPAPHLYFPAVLVALLFLLSYFCVEEKKPKVKKPKSEFPVYTVLESSAYIPSYDHGASIEEIEEQMDDWLGGRNRTPKKKVSSKPFMSYIFSVGLFACLLGKYNIVCIQLQYSYSVEI